MTSLVTGANGHLGNNIVRHLLSCGEEVIAGVRNVKNTKPFDGLACELRYTDLLNKDSLDKALKGVDVLYQAGAVFKRWSKDPEKDIIEANREGTRNILEAAARNGVKKIVYISSDSALDRTKLVLDGTNWNPTTKNNPYPYSKTESEKLAHELGKKLGLDISFILPAVILGPHFSHVTPSLTIFTTILGNKFPFLPKFNFLMVDARDLASACYMASKKGKPFERYVISNENTFSLEEIFLNAQKLFPSKKIKVPKPISKFSLLCLAGLSEITGKVFNKAPLMTRGDVNEFWESKISADISKAKIDLGFQPRMLGETIKDTFIYLESKKYELGL